LKFRNICLRNFRLAETVLQIGVKQGLTLYQIGTILYTEDPDQKAPIQEIIENAELIYAVKKSQKSKFPLIWESKRSRITKTWSGLPINGEKDETLEEEKESFKKPFFLSDGEILSPNRILRRMSEHAEMVPEKLFKPYQAHDKNNLTPSPAANHMVEKIDKDTIPARPSIKFQPGYASVKKDRISIRNSLTNIQDDSANPSQNISEESNDEDETAETTPLEGKRKRKSSSIPASMHRVASLPQMSSLNEKLANGKTNENDCNGEEKHIEEELVTKKVKEEKKRKKNIKKCFMNIFRENWNKK